MHDSRTLNRLMVTALVLALAAMLAGPASARPTPSANGSNEVSDSTPTTVIPYLSHGIGVDESQFTGTSTAAKAPTLVIPYLSHGIGVDESQFTGAADQTSTATAAVIPYLSHGIGVDESQFTGAADQTSTATAAGADGWYEWESAGVAAGAGFAALLLATLSTLAYRSRHGRTAMS